MTMDRATALRLARNGALALFALVAVAVLVRYQAVQSPLYESSRAYVETMEDAFRRIEAGSAEPEDFSDAVHGFVGFRISDPAMIGLVGGHGGRCFVVWFRNDIGAGAGFLGRALPCTPGPGLTFSASYAEQVVVLPSGPTTAPEIDWDRLLPSPATPAWFILVISLLIWLAFNSFVSITIIMIRRRRKT